MATLTKRQKEILDYIEQSITKNGYAPTLEEIGERFELRSMATVHKHLSNLETKGLIRRKWNHSRAIEITEERRRPASITIPLLGSVAAGRPIEAIEGNDTIDVPQSLIRKRDSYALRVTGDSMMEEGILDGDVILVEERPDPRNGDVVVATVDGEATVKRFYREKNGSVRLQPSNAAYKPIVVENGDLKIRGGVVGLVRRYH
ncbi:MAG TPA: transcriptional repressor LexA [Candidatus Limnocylindrales bacterium]|nr:transcriptional repressor LexA [Candidatus Limnocylindrales bacterium]